MTSGRGMCACVHIITHRAGPHPLLIQLGALLIFIEPRAWPERGSMVTQALVLIVTINSIIQSWLCAIWIGCGQLSHARSLVTDTTLASEHACTGRYCARVGVTRLPVRDTSRLYGAGASRRLDAVFVHATGPDRPRLGRTVSTVEAV